MKKFKPWASMTPREQIIEGAAAAMRRNRAPKTLDAAHACIEEVIVWDAQPGTYGAAQKAYYQNTNQNALERLVRAVLREYERTARYL